MGISKTKLHPAWTAAGVTFLTLVATAGFRSTPSLWPSASTFCSLV